MDEVQDDLQGGNEGDVQSHEEDKNCTTQAQALDHVAEIPTLGSTLLAFSVKD